MTIPRITAEHMVCPICTLDWERCVCIDVVRPDEAEWEAQKLRPYSLAHVLGKQPNVSYVTSGCMQGIKNTLKIEGAFLLVTFIAYELIRAVIMLVRWL